MRDRLIELLENATGTQYYGDEIVKTEIDIDGDDIKRIADYLLANGIIAPPCKVGDTVYMPWKWNDRNGIAVLTVTHIIRDRLKKYIKTDFYTDDENYYNAYNCGNFGFDEVGVIVFTRIEAAEQALKESESDG